MISQRILPASTSLPFSPTGIGSEEAARRRWFAVLRFVARVCSAPFGRSLQVAGNENLPPPPRLIAANHPNASDAFLLPEILPKDFHVLVQADIFSLPLFGSLLSSAGQIPVTCGGGRAALETGCARLSEGGTVVIFPEGKLNPEGAACRAATGTIRMALNERVTIVPLGFYVPPEFTLALCLPFNGRLARGRWQVRGACFAQIGEPWEPHRETTHPADPTEVRRLTETLMERIGRAAAQAKERSER